MKKIEFSETTLTSNASFSFKEKIEIARCLDRMREDAIEIAPVENERTDTLSSAPHPRSSRTRPFRSASDIPRRG